MRRLPAGAKLSVVSKVPRPVLGPTQPPIQLVPGSYFLRVRRPWLEVDHSALSSAEVKNKWSYTSTAAYAFTVCVKFSAFLVLHGTHSSSRKLS